MKKSLWFFTILFSFGFTATTAQAGDRAYRVTVLSADPEHQNVVILDPEDKDQQWLLHYRNGCNALKKETPSLELIIRGDLNETGEILRLAEFDQCTVDEARRINAMFRVEKTYLSDTESILTDLRGDKRYGVGHSTSCRAIRNFQYQTIYADLGDAVIEKGDRLYLPGKNAPCTVRSSYLVEPIVEVERGKDFARPGNIHDLKATPASGAVTLSWRIAREEEQVAYYWVSHDRFRLQTKELDLTEMPNLERAETNFYQVENLDNNKEYFFYVIAVGQNGNPADGWSNAARATPQASILRPAEKPSGSRMLQVRLKEETAGSFLFEWDKLPQATQYFVALENGKKREFAFFAKDRQQIRILKNATRKNRDLNLLVRALNRFGLLDEVYYNFRF